MTKDSIQPDMPSDEGKQGESSQVTNNLEPQPLKRRTPWNTLAARVISLVSRKGGVGKTTSAVNLGAALALSGHSVLIVGLDPQCGVSRTLGYGQAELKSGLLEIFTGSQTITDLVHTTPLKDLYFVSPNIWSLDEEESYLELMEQGIDTFITEIDRVRNLFDTIFIDCPPNLGPATRAALLASDSYLVPVQAEELCRDSLERLLTFIQSFHADAHAEFTTDRGSQTVPGIDLEGMFLTMASERTRMGKHVSAKVSEAYGENLFQMIIPRTVRLTEMALRGKPIVIFDRKSAGSRAYFKLADEMLERFQSRNGGQGGSLSESNGDFPRLGHRALPGSVELESGETNPATSTAPSDSHEVNDLEKLLADLKAGESSRETLSDTTDPVETPELISLDEVLAEEERAEDDGDWGSSMWDSNRDRHGRPN